MGRDVCVDMFVLIIWCVIIFGIDQFGFMVFQNVIFHFVCVPEGVEKKRRDPETKQDVMFGGREARSPEISIPAGGFRGQRETL